MIALSLPLLAALPTVASDFDFVEALPSPFTPDGILVYGISGLLILIGLLRAVLWYRNRETEEVTLSDILDEETLQRGDIEQQVLDDVAERHQGVIAPSAIEWKPRMARVGDQWTSTMYVVDYPDYPKDGYLSELFNRTDVEFDLTVHLRPKSRHQASKELKRAADNLHVDADLDRSVRGLYLKERAEEATATYKAVENGTQVFAQSMFITVRADDRDTLREVRSKIQRDLRETPANLTPKTAICRQDQALQAAAPIGTNTFGGDAESIALGDAIGALIASAHNPTILEEGGVEVGLHRDTKSPIVIDPFARKIGYAMFTVGDPGAGKSFGAKQTFMRSIEQSPDRLGIIIEPKRNWVGVAEALGARRIPVAGDVGLNPLEIKPVPEHIRSELDEGDNPLNERKDSAMSFLRNFFAMRGIDLGDRLVTLEFSMDIAYDRAGISEDLDTHGRESPTIRDMRAILKEMADHPDEFETTEIDAGKIQEDAEWLYHQLRPFAEDGRYSNLGRQTEFDIRGEKLVYLDFGHQTSNVGTRTILVMQLLISLMYERAKETPNEVVMVIDESKYLMKHAENLRFLETVFRHHRHHDLSIRLVTQTVNEFFQHDESEIILDQCAVKQFHHLDGMDEKWASEFGLNHAQMKFVQKAIPGEEEAGFSQALVGVDGEWRGIEVRAMEKEQQVIDFQPIEQSHEELPGPTQTEPLDPTVEAFREELEADISRQYPGESKASELDPSSEIDVTRADGGDATGDTDIDGEASHTDEAES